MPAPVTDPSLGTVSAALLSENPEIRQLAEDLFRDAVRSMRHTLRWGSPAERASLHRAVLSVLFKGLGNLRSKEADLEGQMAYRELREELAAAIGSNEDAA